MTLTQADLDAIADTFWNYMEALTLGKFISLKDL